MQERTWVGLTLQGNRAEYYYYESESACWASRKIGNNEGIPRPVARGLTNKQVEELFDNPSPQKWANSNNRNDLLSKLESENYRTT